MERSIIDKTKIIDLTSHPEACEYVRELENKLFDIRDRILNEVVRYRADDYVPTDYDEGWDIATQECLKIIGDLNE